MQLSSTSQQKPEVTQGMSQFEKIPQNVLKVQHYLHQRLPFKLILTKFQPIIKSPWLLSEYYCVTSASVFKVISPKLHIFCRNCKYMFSTRLFKLHDRLCWRGMYLLKHLYDTNTCNYFEKNVWCLMSFKWFHVKTNFIVTCTLNICNYCPQGFPLHEIL